MKRLDEFLADLESRDVKIWVEDERLRYRAPKGVVTSELAEELHARKTEILNLLGSSHAAPIPRIPDAEDYELSHAQRRLWVLIQLEDEVTAYNIPLHLLFHGPLDRSALEAAFARLIQRHESLRSTFTTVGGEPRQNVHAFTDFQIDFVDCSGDGRGEEKARRLGWEGARKPFDLERGPLLRVTLVRLETDKHAFLFTMHHIVSDGWSIGLLSQELMEQYRASLLGQEDPRPPLRVQYRDYAHWQNRLLEDRSASGHRAYWCNRLSHEVSSLNLPSDFTRPSVQTFNGKELSVQIGSERAQAVLYLCRERNASLFMALLAVVKVLLFRYTGQEDVIVGSPIAGRTHRDLEDQIGFYLNTLALRDRLDATQSFRELLSQVKNTVSEALDHQVYPFDRLVDDLDLQRDLSRSPLFDVAVILQKPERSVQELDGIRIEEFIHDVGISKFDLTFDFREHPDGIHLGIEYNTDIFRPERIQRVAHHFLKLLDSVLRAPDAAIGTLDILPQAERSALLKEFNSTATPLPADRNIVDFIEEAAQNHPDSTAVSFEDRDLTYRELNARSNQLAHQLIDQGVGADVFVGIYIERSLEMVVALLGVLKSGGAYVPLDPAFPENRLRFMVQDSGLRIIVTQASLKSTVPADDTRKIILDASRENINRESAETPARTIKSTDLAYAIYTSGSTGKPKGVQIPHGALLNFLLSMAERPGLGRDDVLLAVTTLSFDIAGLEIYLPLLRGARAVIASRDVTADGIRLRRLLERSGATVMQGTPATWRLLLAAGWEHTRGLKILCGGEALPWTLAEQLIERGDSVWNLYGPTETTIWSTIEKVEKESRSVLQDGVVPIGRPIANTQVYVLDRALQPVPIGVPGELCIGGDGLARGYLNPPELTSEKFVPDPFGDTLERRLYRSGDLVLFEPDGKLKFLGRMDHQVKVRGFRIEMGEIESVLNAHPDIQESIVIKREDASGDARLFAYIIAKIPLDDAALREHMQAKLPDYMVPSAIVALDAFPLTPNGKVDRRSLPEPGGQQLDTRVEYVAPRNETETTIAGLWEGVLKIDRAGVHDNFFAMGGHSLKATQLMYRFQRDLGVDISLLDIFRTPTIARLAAIVETRKGQGYTEIQPLASTIAPSGVVTPLTAEELEMLNE